MPFTGPSQRSNLQVGVAALVLVVLGLVTYSNCLDNPLIIDDKIVIEGDPRVREARYTELLTSEYWPGPRGNLLYRPLTSVSFAWNWAYSSQPRDLRLVNLLLHIGVGLLVLLLTMRLTFSLVGSTAAAAMFMVHPVHTTVLNSVVDRAELGAAFFGLLALLLYWPEGPPARAGESQGKFLNRRSITAIMGAASFAVALFFKENAITVFGVVLLADLCRFDRQPGRPDKAGPPSLSRRLVLRYLPMLLVIVAFLLVRAGVLGSVARPTDQIAVVDNIIAHPTHGLTEGDSRFLARWGTPLAVFGKASGLLFRGGPLCWDYSFAAIESVKRVTDPRLLFGIACLGVVAAAMVISFRRRRLVFFGLGFVLITYSLTSNTAVVIGTIFAERYLYLPSAGFCLVVGVASAAAFGRLGAARTRTTRTAAGVFLLFLVATIVGFAHQTISRNRDFISEGNLNRVDLLTNPRSCRLLAAVAGDSYAAGDFSDAVGYADRAIEICPEFSDGWQLAGLSLWRTGRVGEALPLLQRAGRLGAPNDEQVSVAIADIYKASGDYRTAIGVLEAFLDRCAPSSAAGARNNLAWYLVTAEPPSLRNPGKALPIARQAVEIDGRQADHVDTLASVLVALNRHDEAVAALEELIPGVAVDDPFRGPLVQKLEDLRASLE